MFGHTDKFIYCVKWISYILKYFLKLLQSRIQFKSLVFI